MVSDRVYKLQMSVNKRLDIDKVFTHEFIQFWPAISDGGRDEANSKALKKSFPNQLHQLTLRWFAFHHNKRKAQRSQIFHVSCAHNGFSRLA